MQYASFALNSDSLKSKTKKFNWMRTNWDIHLHLVNTKSGIFYTNSTRQLTVMFIFVSFGILGAVVQNGSVPLFTRQNHQPVAPNTTIHFEDTEDPKAQEKKKERLSFSQKLKLKMNSAFVNN